MKPLLSRLAEGWTEVERYAQSRLVELRHELESTNCPDDRTQQIRGAIDEVKELLGLPDKQDVLPTVQPDDEASINY